VSVASVAFAGTPGYVAPEVVAGSMATPSSDIFSFGCLAYFLLSGHVPFTGKSTAEALTRVLTFDPPPLPNTVPTGLAQLIMECLDKKPEGRPASMGQLSERLKTLSAICGVWTQADAERWWASHPAPISIDAAQSGPQTFFLKQRSTGASRNAS
jgi:serine/threonine protein kinase